MVKITRSVTQSKCLQLVQPATAGRETYKIKLNTEGYIHLCHTIIAMEMLQHTVINFHNWVWGVNNPQEHGRETECVHVCVNMIRGLMGD